MVRILCHLMLLFLFFWKAVNLLAELQARN